MGEQIYGTHASMMIMTWYKMGKKAARKMFAALAWESAAWVGELTAMADEVTTLPEVVMFLFVWRMEMNERYEMLVLDVGLVTEGGKEQKR